MTQTELIESRKLNKVYESIMDNSKLVIYVKDLEGKYLYVNEVFLKLFKLTLNEIIGKSDFDIFPKSVAEEFRVNDMKASMNGEFIEVEEKVIFNTTTEFYLSIKYPLKNEADEIVGMSGISKNITEMVKTQNELAQSEKNYRTLVSNIQGVVYRCSVASDWKMFYISQYIKELSGYDADDFLDNKVRSYASVIHPDDAELVEKAVYNGLFNQTSYIITYRIVCKNGDIKWVHEKGCGYYEKGSKNASYLDGVIVDITEEKNLSEALEVKVKQRTKDLSDVNRLLTETVKKLELSQYELVENKKMTAINSLVKGICHEIGSPLGNNLSLNGFIGDKLQNLLSDIQNKSVGPESISASVSELIEINSFMTNNIVKEIDIIENLRMISDSQNEQDNKEIYPKKFFESILNSMKMQYLSKSINYQVECEDHLVIQSVPSLLYQIVGVLFENSVVHGFEHMDAGEINVSIRNTNEHIEIVYQDNGVGIDERIIDKIHDPYFTTRMGLQSGLGLYTVFLIITKMLNGSIKYNSKLDYGTSFLIKLPVE